MNNSFIIFVLVIVTIYFIVGMLFTMMIRLGIGIIIFMIILYLYYDKQNYINHILTKLNPISMYRKRKKERTYRKLKKVWSEILTKYHSNMICPECGQEITVFTIDMNGKCTSCGKKLV